MTMEKQAEKPSVAFIPGFWAWLAIGGLIGYRLSGDLFSAPLYFVLGTFCVGFAWAYLFLQWADMIGEAIALLRDPIPASLNVADREAVRKHLDQLKGRQQMTVRAKNLLQSWILAASPREVIALAAFQGAEVGRPVLIGGILTILLFVIGIFLYANPWLTWGGMAVLAATLFARQNLLGQVSWYFETHLLSRLPGNLPNTAMTAADLADALGTHIKAAFRDSVPQPEATADAMKAAVEGVVARGAGEVEKLQQILIQSQSTLVDRWMHAAEATTSDLKNIESSLSTIVNNLTGGLSTNADKLNSMFSGHTKDMDRALGTIAGQLKTSAQEVMEKLQESLKLQAEQVRNSGGDWSGKIKDILTEHVNRIEATNHELADQLDKVATLEKNIENVLHIQEVVDGTLKTVAASEEFSKLISTLREHLQASDTLLREVSKPRTIRLVEQDLDMGMTAYDVPAEESAPEPPPPPTTTKAPPQPGGKKK